MLNAIKWGPIWIFVKVQPFFAQIGALKIRMSKQLFVILCTRPPILRVPNGQLECKVYNCGEYQVGISKIYVNIKKHLFHFLQDWEYYSLFIICEQVYNIFRRVLFAIFNPIMSILRDNQIGFTYLWGILLNKNIQCSVTNPFRASILSPAMFLLWLSKL